MQSTIIKKIAALYLVAAVLSSLFVGCAENAATVDLKIENNMKIVRSVS